MQLKIAQVAGLLAALDSKVTTASNVGAAGQGLFKQKSATDLQFFKLQAGTGIAALSASNDIITISVDVGTGPSKILQLDSNGRIPAVDGRHVTNLAAAALTGSGTLPLTTLALPQGQFYIGDASNNPVAIAKSGIPLSGFAVPVADIDIGARKIFTSASVWATNELVPKSYVDAVAQGTVFKEAAKVATTTNINLSAPGSTIDGISMVVDDRVLVKNQTAGETNGIYLYKGPATPMVRATDADSESDLRYMAIYIAQGTHAFQSWRLLTDPPITVGTTVLSFTQISGAGEILAGDGLQKSGLTLSVKGDGATIGIVNSNTAVISSGTAGQVLRSTGNVAQAATWGALDLANASAVTGTLPINRGGTGLNSIAQHSIIAAITGAAFETLIVSTGSVIGRRSSGNIVALSKGDLRELLGLRPVVDVANCVAGNMQLISLSQTPDDATKVQVYFNGVMLRYGTHFSISGQTVTATNTLNALYGGTGADGLGFSNSDLIIAVYTY